MQKLVNIKNSLIMIVIIIVETLWLRLMPVTRYSVEFEIDKRASCLVQVVGYLA